MYGKRRGEGQRFQREGRGVDSQTNMNVQSARASKQLPVKKNKNQKIKMVILADTHDRNTVAKYNLHAICRLASRLTMVPKEFDARH